MSYCALFCVLYRKESANKRYRNTVNNLISPNSVSQNDEKPHTAELDDTAIPHVKIEITEIPYEKSPIPQYRPPCPPRLEIHIALSNLNLVVRILAQDHCVVSLSLLWTCHWTMRNPLLIRVVNQAKNLNKLSEFAPSCQLLQFWSDCHGGGRGSSNYKLNIMIVEGAF